MNKNAKKQRKYLPRILTAVGIAVVLAVVWWFNTFTVKITSVTIQSEKIRDKITVVHITDLHGSSFGKDNEEILSKIDKIFPDLIAVTGDMFSSGDESGKKTAVRLLSDLSEKYLVYFVNGEHDNNTAYMDELRGAGVHVLDYKSENIEIGKTDICLYGITNAYYTNSFNLANSFQIDTGVYNILLAHIPKFKAFADFGIDLSLCGDTHGGQVRLPFVGAIQNSGIWFPEIFGNDEEVKRTKGLYEKDGLNLFISSGLGNYPVPLRFMNRPEIAVIYLSPIE